MPRRDHDSKEAIRDKETTEAFLARGGKIQKIPTGFTLQDPLKGRRQLDLNTRKNVVPQGYTPGGMNGPR